MKVLWNSIAIAMWVALLAPGISAQQVSGSADSREPIAEIAGKPVYEQDIAASLQGRLIQLQRQEYQIKKQALDSYIDDQLLAEQAKAKGRTMQALLAQEVDSKVPQPSDDAVHAYYVAQPNLQSQPFDQIKEQLRQALRQALITQARKNYTADLRAKANVEVLLEPPRLNVPYEADRLRGNPDALVIIVEFSDFQCPYCRAAESVVRQVLAKYPRKVSLAYRDLPLRQIHPFAEKAAEAARCAQAQGKFWEYHDLLMADPPRLDQNSLMADARSLHLDEKRFDSCLDSGQSASAVQRDLDAGIALGVTGTPGFFINGEFLSGAQPESVFDKIIQDDLAPANNSRKLAKR